MCKQSCQQKFEVFTSFCAWDIHRLRNVLLKLMECCKRKGETMLLSSIAVRSDKSDKIISSASLTSHQSEILKVLIIL